MAHVTLLCRPVCAAKTAIALRLEGEGSCCRTTGRRGREGEPSRELVEQIDTDIRLRFEQAVLAP